MLSLTWPVTPVATPQTEMVWLTYASESRAPDRVCDSLETGQRLCGDFLDALSGDWVLIEEWANVNVPGAAPRWVRYVERRGEVVEQSVAATQVDRVGAWFRS